MKEQNLAVFILFSFPVMSLTAMDRDLEVPKSKAFGPCRLHSSVVETLKDKQDPSIR